MESVYLTFSFRNWVTVVIMAVLGFALLGAASQWYKNHKAAA